MAQRGLDQLAFADVFKEHADLVGGRLADGESENVEPAVHRGGFAFEPLGDTGLRDAAIGLGPKILDIRLQLAHRLADRIAQARLPEEGIIGFDEAIVVACAVGTEDHLDDAEALVDGVEQQFVARIRLEFPRQRGMLGGGIAQRRHDRPARAKVIGLRVVS